MLLLILESKNRMVNSMPARNMKELEEMLIKKTKRAMNKTSKQVLTDMFSETEGFYAGTQPKEYDRTGALGETPRITDVSKNGNEISFNAYLDRNFTYETGDKPAMGAVLNLANYGIIWAPYVRHTLGKKGFWERAENKMKNRLNNNMNNFFK